jgi:flagellar hook-basal body complex protein FliE
MNISGINSLLGQIGPAAPTAPAIDTNVDSAVGNSSNAFGTLIRGAVDSLDRIQKGAEHEIAKSVAGESQDLHKTIVALQSADLSFQFGLAVRNKLVSAYEDIMRMQV